MKFQLLITVPSLDIYERPRQLTVPFYFFILYSWFHFFIHDQGCSVHFGQLSSVSTGGLQTAHCSDRMGENNCLYNLIHLDYYQFRMLDKFKAALYVVLSITEGFSEQCILKGKQIQPTLLIVALSSLPYKRFPCQILSVSPPGQLLQSSGGYWGSYSSKDTSVNSLSLLFPVLPLLPTHSAAVHSFKGAQ